MACTVFNRRSLLSLVLPVFVSACGSGASETFDLGAVPPIAPKQARRAVISVDLPTAPAILATNRIAIRRPGSDLAYLADAQWSTVLTELVQRRLVQSFQNANLFRAVAETGSAADYILATDIRRFEVDGASNLAVVEMAVRLVTPSTGRVIVGDIVTGQAPAPQAGPVGITAALDQAFAVAAEKVLRFAVSRT